MIFIYLFGCAFKNHLLIFLESMVEAISGWGVTTNSTPIQLVLDNINTFDDKKWNYRSWIPDSIFLLIGPNDRPGPSFVEAYLDLLNRITQRYAHIHLKNSIPIISVCGGKIFISLPHLCAI